MTPSFRLFRRKLAPLLDTRGPLTRITVARFLEWSGLVRGSMQRLANQFHEAGDHARAMRCWEAVRRAAPHDAVVLVSCMACALDGGDIAYVERVYGQARGRLHIPPPRLAWLAGELAVAGQARFAASVLADWQAAVGDPVEACRRMPSMLSPLIGPDVATLAARLAEADSLVTPAIRVELARVVFTFEHPRTAARLYRKALAAGDAMMSPLDRVATCYGDALACARLDDDLEALAEQVSDHADALMSMAFAALVAGRKAAAADWAMAAVRRKHGDAAADEVLDDVRAMLDVLMAWHGKTFELPEMVLDAVTRPADPVPKRFVCGFGWTGSGAVYDAIRGHAGFAEFEGAGVDDVLNADSDTEATFIQSRAGLGELWMQARWGVGVDWLALWDLFRCHVVGMCPIGYSEYKGAAAAANHVRKYGTAYTHVFRRFFDDVSALRRQPERGGLHDVLTRTTEALCRMLLRRTGAKVVLFNNAVFGRNAIMLEIFAGHRAAIVYRDPLDVHADRLRSDKNHWRSARQMAEFYDHGLTRYLDYKAGAPDAAAALREVPFERFVEDARFREKVKAWLLEGVDTEGASHFDPSVSRRNIGIHEAALDDTERRQLAAVVHTRQRMDRQADASWGGDDATR